MTKVYLTDKHLTHLRNLLKKDVKREKKSHDDVFEMAASQ